MELHKLDFISYPYEWPFSVLRAAALSHLKIHLKALEKGITLSDATAFNIQFDGSRAVFIDHLSFQRYRAGQLWYGHRQFCEQFLNPLLLRTMCDIPHNAWYRSNMNGITANDLNTLLPWYRKFSPNILFHVTMHAFFQRKHDNKKQMKIPTGRLPLPTFKNMLIRLHDWIEKLKVPTSNTSVWKYYSKNTVYQPDETAAKQAFIRNYTENVKPGVIWDLGCNTGEYSFSCLESGAKLVIGFDSDPDVLDIAFLRARKENLSFLPLYMDIANPSPSQGWAEVERGGLSKRQMPDGLLALALLHHLVIGRNIPLQVAINWIIDLAPTGVIEFVPKNDPMVKTLLAFREDIFPDYTEENFVGFTNKKARIIKEKILTNEGRKLFWYERQK
ncbi:MAG: class I SAM-dependent methyltransferase [Gammaproteobacteria bacterium]|nr:class I SAM-dependent methyltransferase [Gammaproteobacteria bacterium]